MIHESTHSFSSPPDLSEYLVLIPTGNLSITQSLCSALKKEILLERSSFSTLNQ